MSMTGPSLLRPDKVRETLTRLQRQVDAALHQDFIDDPKLPVSNSGGFYVGDFYIVDRRRRCACEPRCCNTRAAAESRKHRPSIS